MGLKDRLLDEIDRQDREQGGAKKSLLEAELLEFKGEDGGEEAVDILTYVTASWGLNLKPYPLQRLMLKLFYGLPLEDGKPTIELWDLTRTVCEGNFNERQCVAYLYEKGRCSISLEEYEANPHLQRTTVVFRIGRRAGKTTVAQWIAAYTLYRLLKRRSPQRYYNLKPDQPIQIALMATGKEQAIKLLDPARAAIDRSQFLKQYVVQNSTQHIKLTTEENRLSGGGISSGLHMTAMPCSAKSTRGAANLLAILEEYGAFFWELAGSNKSDKSIWDALEPSTSGFKNPVNGRAEGCMLVVSTPLSRESYMNKVEDSIWEGKLTGALALWLPSYWVNPNLTADELGNALALNPQSFRQEYEAEYLDDAEKAFTRVALEVCRQDPGPESNVLRDDEMTWLGFDLGLKGDPTSISIVATNGLGESRLVHHEVLVSGKGHRAGQEELDIVEVAERLDRLWEHYSVKGGFADAWNAPGLKSHLLSGARNRMEFAEVGSMLNDRLARNTLAVVNQGRLTVYLPKGAFEMEGSLFWELVRLQYTSTKADPPRIRISAVAVKGSHDDQYSSLSRALWAAHIGMEDHPGGLGGYRNPYLKARAEAFRAQVEVLRRRAQGGPRSPGSNPLRGRTGR